MFLVQAGQGNGDGSVSEGVYSGSKLLFKTQGNSNIYTWDIFTLVN